MACERAACSTIKQSQSTPRQELLALALFIAMFVIVVAILHAVLPNSYGDFKSIVLAAVISSVTYVVARAAIARRS